ncbi:hypothetical protein AUEXF2481DRAFT_307138 [Aureobasidium subglaciale EXF-2481]|uniref:Uncharacterized protein n=1 Tax=Aureobasidium subglaciale (strain EXF-2481) TaxID=1043005 RepID=A0A074YIA6_AURSE|nr:uncharacterized protein AUEXF2481DRAFT_307138 [Aureobasidium subglaciale EXF-2481]KEQ93822.1 hypothetical protein AUEXF2481DRAFT_307138 [Aureobasidium subglaciale EXF-2481]
MSRSLPACQTETEVSLDLIGLPRHMIQRDVLLISLAIVCTTQLPCIVYFCWDCTEKSGRCKAAEHCWFEFLRHTRSSIVQVCESHWSGHQTLKGHTTRRY